MDKKFKIAVHDDPLTGFSKLWIEYLKEKRIPFKVVNCYSSSIVNDLKDCHSLMWHHNHGDYRDKIFAKELLYAIEHSGIHVFPNFKTSWYFDDKIGQKYLLESLKIPHVKTYIFYNKEEAINWANSSTFPKVFKLRSGAGSENVKKIANKYQAISLINKAFSSGFEQYNRAEGLKERIKKLIYGGGSIKSVLGGLYYYFFSTNFARMSFREKCYFYVQDFIPNNNFDIRVIVVCDKAFAIKRYVRKNDFRASGSGYIDYSRHSIPENIIKTAFTMNDKLDSQCTAFDFIYENNKPLVVEISFGFNPSFYNNCVGYWEKSLKFHSGKFNPYAWMVDNLLDKINEK